MTRWSLFLQTLSLLLHHFLGLYWAKKFMEEHGIQFEWIDVQDDPAAREVVERLNDGKRIIPTIIFQDGSILVEPSNAKLAQKLGIST